MPLYLASQSPRRAELLKQLGVAFTAVRGPDIDESSLPGEPARDYVQRIVQAKCAAVLQRDALSEGDLVLVADTTVSVDNDILGKPANAVEATAMLHKLSGRAHEVITGVAVAALGSPYANGAVQIESVLQISTVTFAQLSDSVIAQYIATNEPYDKAGGYGIQGPAGGLISHLQGSFTGVMGLPLYETGQLLKQFNFKVMSP
jgi:septum formation protein